MTVVVGGARSVLGAVLLLAVVGTAAERARAQPAAETRWLLLPSVAGEQSDPKHPARAAATLLNDQLRAQGVRAIATGEAKRLFEQHGSSPPMTASAADIDELAKDAQRALYHVASGLPARAKADVERAMSRARRALESLNRETRAAQHLLDACLFLVRAHLQRGNRPTARTQALECRRLVPDIAPESTVHPPDVIGVLAEAEAQLRAHEPASLRIESEPMGCAAYVNGRNLGPTPRELSRLSPGEYRVQVECDKGVMGRVHRLALSNDRVVLRVDTRYDQVIETLFDLSLNYASMTEERRRVASDAVETARTVGASDVVVPYVFRLPLHEGKRLVQIDRFRATDGKRLARVRVGVDPVAGSIANDVLFAAAEALREGEQVDLSGGQPEPLGAPPRVAKALPPKRDGPPQRETAEPRRPPPPVESGRSESVEQEGFVSGEPSSDRGEDDMVLPITGYVTGGLGLAAQVTGWVLYSRLLQEQEEYRQVLAANPMPGELTVAEANALLDIDAADDAPPIALGIGSLMTTASLPLWLPEDEGVPWWAWAAGSVGAAAAAVGAAVTVQSASCEVDRYDRCTSPAQATDLGPLLLMQAAPLLGVPVVYAIRAWTGDSSAQARLRLGTDRAMLTIQGDL